MPFMLAFALYLNQQGATLQHYPLDYYDKMLRVSDFGRSDIEKDELYPFPPLLILRVNCPDSIECGECTAKYDSFTIYLIDHIYMHNDILLDSLKNRLQSVKNACSDCCPTAVCLASINYSYVYYYVKRMTHWSGTYAGSPQTIECDRTIMKGKRGPIGSHEGILYRMQDILKDIVENARMSDLGSCTSIRVHRYITELSIRYISQEVPPGESDLALPYNVFLLGYYSDYIYDIWKCAGVDGKGGGKLNTAKHIIINRLAGLRDAIDDAIKDTLVREKIDRFIEFINKKISNNGASMSAIIDSTSRSFAAESTAVNNKASIMPQLGGVNWKQKKGKKRK